MRNMTEIHVDSLSQQTLRPPGFRTPSLSSFPRPFLKNTQTPGSHFSSCITAPTLCFPVQATGSISCITLDKSFYLSKPVSLTVKWDWAQKSKHVHTKTCSGMFKTALLVTAKIWKQPKCLSGTWINKLWYIHTMEHYLAIKRNMDEYQNHAGKKPDTK